MTRFAMAAALATALVVPAFAQAVTEILRRTGYVDEALHDR